MSSRCLRRRGGDAAGQLSNEPRATNELTCRLGRSARRGLHHSIKSNTLTCLDFYWDERKAASNVKKQGVSFDEAATVFADPLALAIDDALEAERTLLLGMSNRRRLLLVVHVEIDESTIRIISARRATSHERRRYEEEGQ